MALGDVGDNFLDARSANSRISSISVNLVGERACCMPEPVNTSSSGSKLNEFYEMQRMLIVLVVQSAAFDCP